MIVWLMYGWWLATFVVVSVATASPASGTLAMLSATFASVLGASVASQPDRPKADEAEDWAYVMMPYGESWRVEVERDGRAVGHARTFTRAGGRWKARQIKRRVQRGTWPPRRMERGVL